MMFDLGLHQYHPLQGCIAITDFIADDRRTRVIVFAWEDEHRVLALWNGQRSGDPAVWALEPTSNTWAGAGTYSPGKRYDSRAAAMRAAARLRRAAGPGQTTRDMLAEDIPWSYRPSNECPEWTYGRHPDPFYAYPPHHVRSPQ
jgi:hypothetical protein